MRKESITKCIIDDDLMMQIQIAIKAHLQYDTVSVLRRVMSATTHTSIHYTQYKNYRNTMLTVAPLGSSDTLCPAKASLLG